MFPERALLLLRFNSNRLETKMESWCTGERWKKKDQEGRSPGPGRGGVWERKVQGEGGAEWNTKTGLSRVSAC